MSMPMINSPRSYIPDVTPRLPGNLQTTLIFPYPICLGEMVEVPRLAMGSFKRIYLLEKVEVALVTPFECLVRLFATKDFLCALRGADVSGVRMYEQRRRTSRRHEFFVARSWFQWSSWPGAMSQVKSFVFSSSVQCFAPCPPASMSAKASASSATSRLRFWADIWASGCLRLRAGEATCCTVKRGEAVACVGWVRVGGEVDGLR